MDNLLMGLAIALVWLMIFMIRRVETIHAEYMTLLNEESAWLHAHMDWLIERGLNVELNENYFRRYRTLPSARALYWKFWIPRAVITKNLKPLKDYYVTD